MPRAVAALAALALAAAWAGGVSGCGPIRYVGDVTRSASDAVADARAAEAEKYAPYWWTRATQYLHKAREVAAHADFQAADRYGKLATAAALQAAADARIAAKQPAVAAPPSTPAGEEPAAPSKPTEAPIAPSRDLPRPPAPAKDKPVPAKEQIAPAKEPAKQPAQRPKVAPAKEPP